MRLSKYLADRNLTDSQFAELVGRDRTTVLRWRKHGALPDNEAIEAIFHATHGDVTANDFFHARADASQPEALAS